VFSSSGVTYTAPASGDVLFTVDAQAFVPMSGGTKDCMPSEIPTSKDDGGLALKAIAATTTNVARLISAGVRESYEAFSWA
jgi:hypothetical protein